MRTPMCLIVMIGFLACAPHLSSAGKGLPDWATTHTHPQYPAQTHLLGVGISEESMDRAKEDARLDLTRQIKVRIKSEMVDIQKHAQVGEQETYRNEITNRTEMLVDETVTGMQVVETAEEKGVFYALAALDRRRFAAGLKQEIEDGVQAVTEGMADADRMVREGRIAPAVANLTQAYDRSGEVLSKRVLVRALSPAPPML
ncbi:MAG: hypothetical protein DRP97_08870, partial [Candidatus Latescibacterota bacterium]